MKISVMIKELAEALVANGDVEVRYFDNVSSYPISRVFVAVSIVKPRRVAVWIESHEQHRVNADQRKRLTLFRAMFGGN